MAKLSPEVREYIREAVALSWEPVRQRNKSIIDWVKEIFNVIIDSDDIYEIAVRTRKLKEVIQELNEKTTEEKLYDVVDGHYHFVKEDLLYKIPVEEIDGMFYDFSKHWANLTGEQMLAKYQLKPEVWHMIKNRLRLYKDSNVISPHTAETTPEGELEEIITEASARHIDTIKDKMVKTHEKLYAEESKRAIKTLSNLEYFLENVERFIKEYKPKNIHFTPQNISIGIPPLTIAMSDFHFGKAWTKAIVERMSYIRNYVLSQPNTEVQIVSLGDLAEAFVEGGMHPWQEAMMELKGFDLMLFISNIFEQFLSDLYTSGKRVSFVWIGGNHDRLGKTHSDDMQRTWALVVYELIKRGLSKSEIEVKILREKIESFDFWPNRFIIAHGDDGFSNRKPEDILWKNWDNTRHNVILFGDKHNCKISETKNATMIGLPALAGKGEYDARLDLHSESGFIVVEPNTSNSVDIQLRRLK